VRDLAFFSRRVQNARFWALRLATAKVEPALAAKPEPKERHILPFAKKRYILTLGNRRMHESRCRQSCSSRK